MLRQFDFRALLDPTVAQRYMPPGTIQTRGLYQGHDGVQFRTLGPSGEAIQEIVQVTDGALLLASTSPGGKSVHDQAVNDSDWIHIQFRLNCYGQERVSDVGVIETPQHSCVVTRYPQSSVVTRVMQANESYRVACLLLRPKALTALLDVSASSLPQRIHWLTGEERLELHATVLPLSSSMRLPVSDVLSCTFTGSARRAFMRAKSLELLSSVIHALDRPAGRPTSASTTLSPLDRKKIESARCILTQELESTMTLADLAKRVGLGRTKLAMGFKEIYGLSAQAYWREEKLSRAREMLRSGEDRITDIALRLGYAELSSFTRAFSRKFGELPRTVKSQKI